MNLDLFCNVREGFITYKFRYFIKNLTKDKIRIFPDFKSVLLPKKY